MTRASAHALCALAPFFALGACDRRTVLLADASGLTLDGPARSADAKMDGTRRLDSDALRSDPWCELTSGLSGAGSFDGPTPELDPAPATFTTDGSSIRVLIMLGPERSVEVVTRREGSNPVLPDQIHVPDSSVRRDPWRVTVQYAWCNPMECRIEFHADSLDPSDKLGGAIALEGQLFSDLSKVSVCIRADDEKKRTLFLNVVAYRG